jgi:hypothetical protein
LDELQKLNLRYVNIESKNYIYILPDAIGNIAKESLPLKKLLDKYGYLADIPDIDNVFSQQENRYVKLISNANPEIAQMINDLKTRYYQTQSPDKIPLLHGL